MKADFLRSRLLFSLRKDLFYGMVFGVINQKAKKAVLGLKQTKDDYGRSKTVTEQSTIHVEFTGNLQDLPPIDGNILKKGFDLDGSFKSAPFDFMIGLSSQLSRKSDRYSSFAEKFAVQTLEDAIDNEEWDGVLVHMSMSIPRPIMEDLEKLRSKVEPCVEVRIS